MDRWIDREHRPVDRWKGKKNRSNRSIDENTDRIESLIGTVHGFARQPRADRAVGGARDERTINREFEMRNCDC